MGRPTRVVAGAEWSGALEADESPERFNLVAGQRPRFTYGNPTDVEARVAGAPQGNDRIPDRLAHPPHLTIPTLVQHELEP